MSKLCDAIEARQTGRVQVSPETGLLRTEETGDYRSAYRQYEYRLGVVLQMHAVVPENSPALARAKDHCKRAIIEAVFGEFRPKIIEINTAMHERKYESAMLKLDELYNEMFS